ncbi:MAG: hypothetical protein K2N14_00600, partial [Clostridia bacterium]|nr:hypothetical protein [Clostridia bacterium]
MRKSRLFNFIIERCNHQSEKVNGVSVDCVVLETLNYLSACSSGAEKVEADFKDELNKVKAMFDKYGVNYKKAARGIKKFIEDDEDFIVIGRCQYLNIITCLEIGGNDGDIITLDKFMHELFKLPSDAVKEYIIG